ncbi:MAG: hypothetical protein ACLQJR_05695 [Stellaceae bacterium]
MPRSSLPHQASTIGNLLDNGIELHGSCADCAQLYRKDIPWQHRAPSAWKVYLPALIAERGHGSPVVRMRPLTCPYCGGRNTSIVIIPPSRGTS